MPELNKSKLLNALSYAYDVVGWVMIGVYLLEGIALLIYKMVLVTLIAYAFDLGWLLENAIAQWGFGILSVVLVVLWLVGLVITTVVAFFFIHTGLSLRHRVDYWGCVISAGFMCLGFPLGTMLGVATGVLLFQPEIKNQFEPKTST